METGDIAALNEQLEKSQAQAQQGQAEIEVYKRKIANLSQTHDQLQQKLTEISYVVRKAEENQQIVDGKYQFEHTQLLKLQEQLSDAKQREEKMQLEMFDLKNKAQEQESYIQQVQTEHDSLKADLDAKTR